jgi:Na+-transporting methylmalonyl-CoA/oxaloacetate decarboxylase gamma subunit
MHVLLWILGIFFAFDLVIFLPLVVLRVLGENARKRQAEEQAQREAADAAQALKREARRLRRRSAREQQAAGAHTDGPH